MSVPKAVLYYAPKSVWSAAVLLALEEKGYAQDEVDLRMVDLAKGENFDPTFLRLNSKATVPTLVVPFEDTVSNDVVSRYKAVTDSTDIIAFLDKGRSPLSHTHSTSAAPAISLAPATVAFSDAAKSIIELLHSDSANPNNLLYLARDDASLKALRPKVEPLLSGKYTALEAYINEAQTGKIHVSQKVQQFWKEKQDAAAVLLTVFKDADIPEGELDKDATQNRHHYFELAQQSWETGLKTVLQTVNKGLIGPFAFGEQFSVADLHLAAYLARVGMLVGATAEETGETVVSKLEKYVGALGLAKDYAEEQTMKTKLEAFWDGMRERASWRKIYQEGLY